MTAAERDEGEALALDFKSATLYAVRVVLHSADTASLEQALAQRMAEAGSFFENEPVVIDAGRLESSPDWPALVAALRARSLPPIGVAASGAVLEAAVAAGLTPVELSAPAPRQAAAGAGASAASDAKPAPGAGAAAASAPGRDAAQPSGPAAPAVAPQALAEPARALDASVSPQPADEEGDAPAPAAPPSEAPAVPAMVVNRPLRSGQRVYARGADLIVIGMVSQGAEVIADGNIHVYGPLRGKAMAGARGDASARIFTTQLDAELLAVAGIYRVVEDKLPAALHNLPVQVRLEGDTLKVEPLQG